ncbi:hypothetical protein TRV_08144 [Trichophyton verrucosum HKI 0517]|uniref:BZIP domain-containing protein n=1 Tax=Trichophyton verrucosum (strain HKI 0517) TaxID=663202 RepID=D4DLS0_TRIVH|nr:uncharacterized protein TRV_08144 [Trichophyton verrucosum HKI 0517]EFE37204.1 hypothetical protein TRV_08144 [Trichophyton verrucosum HKI 0517]
MHMEQPSDSTKKPNEQEEAQRENEMKERRRLQNRIAQRNHRRRKHNRNKSISQEIPEGIDTQEPLNHVFGRDIQQASENSLLSSPSSATPGHVADAQENSYAYLSPPNSLSPEILLDKPGCHYEANDDYCVPIGPESLFDSKPFEGPRMNLNTEPRDTYSLSPFIASRRGAQLPLGTGFDTVRNLDQPMGIYLQPNLGSVEPSTQMMQISTPEEHPGFVRQSSAGDLGVPGLYIKTRTCPNTVDRSIQFPDSSLIMPLHADHESKLDGKVALHLSAERGHTSTVKCLLEYGSDIKIKDNSGATALHYAAKMGHTSIVMALLDNGADGNTKDYQGRTPLHMAAERGHEDAVRLLVESGVDIDA